MNIINRLAHAKFNTSKMHRIPKPLKNVPANNCHLKVSESVAKAMELTGGPAAEETVKFVLLFDRFFDTFNVNSYNEGRHKRKVFRQPFRSADDFRLKVIIK